MGDILSKIDDDYDDYVDLCKTLQIKPVNNYIWNYEETQAVKLVRDKRYTLSQARTIANLSSKQHKIVAALHGLEWELQELNKLIQKLVEPEESSLT